MVMREGALLYVDRACARFTCQVLDRLAFCQGSQAFTARLPGSSKRVVEIVGNTSFRQA